MKRVIFVPLFVILVLFFSGFAIASLGISPAKKEFTFSPGEEIVIRFSVLSDNPNRKIDAYANGDFSEYVTLSKTELVGPESFTATIKLPENADKPGANILGIGVKERPSENEFIGTVIDISATIVIFVPYPGKYAEVKLNVENGNINEQIPVEVKVINRGIENISADVDVNFYSNLGVLTETIGFSPSWLEPGEEKYFRKYLNTSGFLPGDYLAEAVVGYSGQSTILNKTFRVGSLFVNVTNFTTVLPKKGIQRFLVNIESKWNNRLDEVFADINISNNIHSLVIRTPSIALGPWQKNILTGFLDTTELSGRYNVDITLFYAGEKSSASGMLVIKESNLILIVLLVSGIAVLIILAAAFIVWKRKAKKRKK